VSSSSRSFERTGGRVVHRGRIIDVVQDTFRFADGTEVERDIVRHAGAVAVVAVDDDAGVVYLVRQPREAVGDPDVLELPAGRLDKEGEEPEASARRELARRSARPRAAGSSCTPFWSSVGALDEVVHVFLARTSPTSTPTRARTSASRSSPGRSPTSTERSPRSTTPRRSSA
jgi:ADP-ribose pyrophosphatase